MKIIMDCSFRIVVSIVFFQLCFLSVNSAIIPVVARSFPVTLSARAVTYGDTQNDGAKSAICNDDQKKVFEQSMVETTKLAKAGVGGLEIIEDMLTDDKTKYRALDRKDQIRIRDTYFTFFGKIRKEDQFPLFRDRVKFIKDKLGRIQDLSVETWPSDITFFCDSTYYQDTDADGKRWNEVSPPKKAPAKDFKEWKYDVDRKIWAETSKRSNCHLDGSTTAAYTLNFSDEQKDRITFCPEWFSVIKAPEAGPSITDLDPTKDIQKGTLLKTFTRKAARIFLHEHLHTYVFNQAARNADKLWDANDPNSYGPDNAQALAKSNQDKANRNIENVVYWCIAMYYSGWDWSSLSAEVPSADPPSS